MGTFVEFSYSSINNRADSERYVLFFSPFLSFPFLLSAEHCESVRPRPSSSSPAEASDYACRSNRGLANRAARASVARTYIRTARTRGGRAAGSVTRRTSTASGHLFFSLLAYARHGERLGSLSLPPPSPPPLLPAATCVSDDAPGDWRARRGLGPARAPRYENKSRLLASRPPSLASALRGRISLRADIRSPREITRG